MRFTSLLLLATAVAGTRIQHRVKTLNETTSLNTTSSLNDTTSPVNETIFPNPPPHPDPSMIIEMCDTDRSKTLSQSEVLDCLKYVGAPEKILESIKKFPADKWPKKLQGGGLLRFLIENDIIPPNARF